LKFSYREIKFSKINIPNGSHHVVQKQWVCVDFRDFTISYLATDDTGEDVYLSLLSDWDLDAAFFSASSPCLRLKVDLKPFEPGMIVSCTRALHGPGSPAGLYNFEKPSGRAQ